MVRKLKIDWLLFAAVAALTLFGLAMVYSASIMVAIKDTKGANQYMYAVKQFVFAVIGLGVMLAMTRFDYRWLRNRWLVWSLLMITVCMLLAVFGFGATLGARRWMKFGGFSFQSSELAKITLPLFLAFFYSKVGREELMGDFQKVLLPSGFISLIIIGLVFIEPDLGTAMVLSAVFGVVYLVAGANWRHFAMAFGSAFVVGLGALILVPWRMRRIFAFLDPWADAERDGYQLVQSLIAVGSGGTWGVGFANSQQKIYYLPFPHSDFIFAIIAEEFGLVGTLLVLTAFGVILWRGSRAALCAPDRFGKLLGIGLLTGIIAQAFFNMSVVIGLLPTKGIPLPFISYGGSSIVVTLAAMGLLLNISQYVGISDSDETENRDAKVRKSKLQTSWK